MKGKMFRKEIKMKKGVERKGVRRALFKKGKVFPGAQKKGRSREGTGEGELHRGQKSRGSGGICVSRIRGWRGANSWDTFHVERRFVAEKRAKKKPNEPNVRNYPWDGK